MTDFRVFRDDDLRGARFTSVDLSDAVIRGSDVLRMEIDSPWLFDGETFLRVNGVDVLPYVAAELNRRFPGRELQHAVDPEGLRQAWAAVDGAWTTLLDRAAALGPGAVDESVDGEWSVAQTVRHLVYATDLWLGRSVLGRDELHPLGVRYGTTPDDPPPPLADVLAARDSRRAQVSEFLAAVTSEQLDEPRPSPHDPERTETVRHCLRTILEEGWEHLRYATRDLDAIAATAQSSPRPPST